MPLGANRAKQRLSFVRSSIRIVRVKDIGLSEKQKWNRGFVPPSEKHVLFRGRF
jgi:hypothetical protein